MTEKTKWSIDPAHSEIAFKIKHLMISNVRGIFRKFDGDISTSAPDFTTAGIEVWIDTSSIDTGSEKRDEHLRSSEFFDASTYKQITFSGGTLKKSAKNAKLELSGTLTIKDISKKIQLEAAYGGKVKDPWGNEKVGFTVTGKINRKDWGLNWNASLESGGFMVGDEVEINCEIQLIKANKPEMEMRSENLHNEDVAV